MEVQVCLRRTIMSLQSINGRSCERVGNAIVLF
jgi:hypothetical protein